MRLELLLLSASAKTLTCVHFLGLNGFFLQPRSKQLSRGGVLLTHPLKVNRGMLMGLWWHLWDGIRGEQRLQSSEWTASACRDLSFSKTAGKHAVLPPPARVLQQLHQVTRECTSEPLFFRVISETDLEQHSSNSLSFCEFFFLGSM